MNLFWSGATLQIGPQSKEQTVYLNQFQIIKNLISTEEVCGIEMNILFIPLMNKKLIIDYFFFNDMVLFTNATISFLLLRIAVS